MDSGAIGGEPTAQERPPYWGAPISATDEELRAALNELSVPTLMASLAHILGSTEVLRGEIRPAGIYLNEIQGFMDPEALQAARALAFDVLRDYRDRGSPVAEPLGEAEIAEIMSYLAAQPIPDEYVPMMMEELSLDGTDSRARGWPEGLSDRLPPGLDVIVIGGGMSGVLAGIRLQHAGIPYTILEKNEGIGGTWFENRYPGCRVDVGNHYYCYSFEPSDEWSEFFAQAPELRAYFEDCAARHGLGEHTQLGAEVIEAEWSEAEHRWTVRYRQRNAAGVMVEHERSAAAVISAVGQLNRPKLPEIEGIDTFEGTWCHSAEWNEDLAIDGARVGVIGTGASAFQIVPTIADRVEHLSVFQRSAPWMFANPHYHDRVPAGVGWALRHLPYYGRWFRFLLLWPACDGGLPAMTIDPDWPHQDRAISEINDLARQMFTQYLADQIDSDPETGDPELLEKVTPNYVCLGKRTLQDNGSWLAALQRPNVDLIAHGVESVHPKGVRTTDGTFHELDSIVYATGFNANKFLWPMRIIGRGGRVLSEVWGFTPTALLGITVPGFPNLFCLYGPGTNLAHGGSLIFHSECEMRYIMGCLAVLASGDAVAIEETVDAHDRYQERLQARMEEMVWSHPSIEHSWYRSPDGRIYPLSPWRLVDFWAWTSQPDLSHFELTR